MNTEKDDTDEETIPKYGSNGIKTCNGFRNSLCGELITVLKLVDLELTELPEELPGLSNMYEINLSGNKLCDLPPKLLIAKGLRILNVANNKLSSMPECLKTGLRALKCINLANNCLSHFDEPPACLPLLKELILAHNLIEIVPHWILSDYVFMLDVLDLSFNPCFGKVREFKFLSQNRIRGCIKNLQLRNTDFTVVSLGLLLYFPSLISLDISNIKNCKKLPMNRVFDFAKVYIPKTLVELRLKDVCLASLPDVSSLNQLKILDVSENFLQLLPRNGILSASLQCLDLSRTMLIILPDYIAKLQHLTHLMLAENDIASLPNSFHLLHNLEVLDLYKNSFQSMPEIGTFNKLKALDVWMNYFEPPLKPMGENGPTYEDLNKNLREKFSFHDRYNSVKEVIQDISTTEESSSFHSTSPDVSFVSPLTESLKDLTKAEEENWELGSDDDFFDPSADHQSREAMYRDFSNRDFGKNCLKFCPEKIKNSPHLFQPYAERSISECWKQRRLLMQVGNMSSNVDGQFEDA